MPGLELGLELGFAIEPGFKPRLEQELKHGHKPERPSVLSFYFLLHAAQTTK